MLCHIIPYHTTPNLTIRYDSIPHHTTPCTIEIDKLSEYLLSYCTLMSIHNNDMVVPLLFKTKKKSFLKHHSYLCHVLFSNSRTFRWCKSIANSIHYGCKNSAENIRNENLEVLQNFDHFTPGQPFISFQTFKK